MGHINYILNSSNIAHHWHPIHYIGSLAMCGDSLIVNRVLRVRKVEDNGGVRLRTAAIREFLLEVDSTVEAHAAVLVEVNV